MNELVEMAKLRLQVAVREDIVKWIDQRVDKLRFANRSHAFGHALLPVMESKKRNSYTHGYKLR